MKETDSVVCRYDRKDILRGLKEIILNGKKSTLNYSYKNEDAVKELKERSALFGSEELKG